MKLVLDIGGNGVQYQVYNEKEIIINSEFSTIDKDKDYVLDKIAEIASKNNVDKIAIASPCAVITSTGELIGTSAIKDYQDFNLYNELKQRFDRDIFIIAQNDANAALLGSIEKGVDSAIIMTIGSGIGGAIYMNGKIQTGHQGFSGEFGYFPTWQDGKLTNASAIIGTNALVKRMGPKYKNAREIFADNEKDIKKLMEWFDDLAAFIIGINYSIDPQYVYLTGGITKNKEFERMLLNSINKTLSVYNWLVKRPNIKIVNIENAALVGMKTLI